MTIGMAVAEQFARIWEMYREAIRGFPEEQWKAGDVNCQIPAWLVYHAIEGSEFYAQATPIEGFVPGARFGVNWQDSPPKQLPTQEQMLTYLDEVQAQAEAWLRGMKDSDLLSPNPPFAWAGRRSALERALGQLRHTQHHLGQLNAELRRRNLPSAEWR